MGSDLERLFSRGPFFRIEPVSGLRATRHQLLPRLNSAVCLGASLDAFSGADSQCVELAFLGLGLRSRAGLVQLQCTWSVTSTLQARLAGRFIFWVSAFWLTFRVP